MHIDKKFIHKIIMALWQAEDMWLELTALPPELKIEQKKLLLHLSNLLDSHCILLSKNVNGKDQVRLTSQGQALAENICVEKKKEEAMLNLSRVARPRVEDDPSKFGYAELSDIDVIFKI